MFIYLMLYSLTKSMKTFSLNKVLLLMVLLAICGFLGWYMLVMTRSQISVYKIAAGNVQTKKINKSFILPSPPYDLTISGSVSAKREVLLNPFFFTHSYYHRDPTETLSRGLDKSRVVDTPFSVVFKRKGVTIKKDQLHVSTCLTVEQEGIPTKCTNEYGDFMFSTYGMKVLPDSIFILYKGMEIFRAVDPQTVLPKVNLVSQKTFRDGFGVSWFADSNLKYLAVISNQNLETNQKISENNIIESNVSGTDTFNWVRSASNLRSLNGDFWIAIYATDGFRTMVGFSNKFSSSN